MVSEKNIKQKRSMKKAQAAMEFLMTYSWAILAVLIVIGALATFGVFEFENLLPERCVLGHPLKCEDHLVKKNSTVPGYADITLKISNVDQRKNVNITDISVTSETLTGNCASTPNKVIAGNSPETFKVLANNGSGSENCKLSTTLNRDKNKHEITIKYNQGDASFTRTATGELLARTED